MRIQAAQIIDFRNIARADVGFTARVTALVGANGQGKTNFLEAIYAVAALRPLRNASRRDLIRAGASKTDVRVQVASPYTGLTEELGVAFERGNRSLSRDGRRAEAAEFLGRLVAVAFTPDDLEISKGAPELRRRFLDRALLNARPAYLDRALRYAQAVRARNRVLSRPEVDEALIDAYDEALVNAGAEVASQRAEFARALAPKIEARFAEIARPAPKLEVRYASTLGDELEDLGRLRAVFAERLGARRKSDLRRGTTSVGPHLDDLELSLDGAPARARASQGQHRALVLALKLAEISQLSDALREPPVLLLDDISSELDEGRSRQLFEALRALDGQVLITTTDARQLSLIGELGADVQAAFAVERGVITPWAT